ncbi:MAG: VPLPA-CTERM sorting domain-containing protein [Cypionkella sp.]
MSRHTKSLVSFAAMSLALALMSPAQASVITATSYSMLNGDGQAHGGSNNYWDGSYNGTGSTSTDRSALSGGTGDLTDGVIATQNWNIVENTLGTGPYVGWSNFSPTIDFFFAALTNFTSVTFHFDDSDGSGGVFQPASVNVNGAGHAVPDHPGPSPFAYTVDLTGLTTDQLTVNIFANGPWIFLSEVTFAGQIAAVPLPAGGILLLGALGGLACLRRRTKTGGMKDGSLNFGV